MDITKLAFYSDNAIDKIVQSDTVTYTVPAGTPVSPGFGTPPNSLKTIPNQYGQKAPVRAAWSLDGNSFNSSQAQLYYYSATFMEPIIQASVNVGCDSLYIYLWLINNYTADLAFTINYAVYTIT